MESCKFSIFPRSWWAEMFRNIIFIISAIIFDVTSLQFMQISYSNLCTASNVPACNRVSHLSQPEPDRFVIKPHKEAKSQAVFLFVTGHERDTLQQVLIFLTCMQKLLSVFTTFFILQLYLNTRKSQEYANWG